jgi:hypothetical protein
LTAFEALSSTVRVSLPAPVTVRPAWMLLTVPVSVGATPPTMIVELPLDPTVVG